MMTTVVQVVAVLVLVAFGALVVITVGTSFIHERHDRHRRNTKRTVRRTILRTLLQSNPHWDELIASFSSQERAAAKIIVRRLLREVSGNEREELLACADELGIGDSAKRDLRSASPVERQIAHAGLALTDQPIIIHQIYRSIGDSPELRESAGRIFYERRHDVPGATEWGTRIVVGDGEHILTAYGLDTLYRLNREDASPLLARGDHGARRWGIDFTVQVLAVLANCQLSVPYREFRWVFELLDHDEPSVRAAAIGVFSGLGWQNDLRSSLPIDRLIDDVSPVVRRATYEVLASWGDEPARERLLAAVEAEIHHRTRLALYRALWDLGVREADEPILADDAAWQWTVALADAGVQKEQHSMVVIGR